MATLKRCFKDKNWAAKRVKIFEFGLGGFIATENLIRGRPLIPGVELWISTANFIAKGHRSSEMASGQQQIVCRSMVQALQVIVPIIPSATPF